MLDAMHDCARSKRDPLHGEGNDHGSDFQYNIGAKHIVDMIIQAMCVFFSALFCSVVRAGCVCVRVRVCLHTCTVVLPETWVWLRSCACALVCARVRAYAMLDD